MPQNHPDKNNRKLKKIHLAISVELADPKLFTGTTKLEHAWLLALKQYFIAIYILYMGNNTI